MDRISIGSSGRIYVADAVLETVGCISRRKKKERSLKDLSVFVLRMRSESSVGDSFNSTDDFFVGSQDETRYIWNAF